MNRAVGGLSTAAAMMVATGATATRVVVEGVRSDAAGANQARNLTRVILGGVLATGGLLLIDAASPQLAAGLATIIMLTALLVHGVALGDAALALVK